MQPLTYIKMGDAPDRGVMAFDHTHTADSVLQHLFNVSMALMDDAPNEICIHIPPFSCVFTKDPATAPDAVRRIDLCDIGLTTGRHIFVVNATIGAGRDHLQVSFSKLGLPVINVSLDIERPRYLQQIENVTNVQDYLRLIRFQAL